MVVMMCLSQQLEFRQVYSADNWPLGSFTVCHWLGL